MAVWGAAISTAGGAAASAAAAMLLRAALLAFVASLLNALCSLRLAFAAAASSTIGCWSSKFTAAF